MFCTLWLYKSIFYFYFDIIDNLINYFSSHSIISYISYINIFLFNLFKKILYLPSCHSALKPLSAANKRRTYTQNTRIHTSQIANLFFYLSILTWALSINQVAFNDLVYCSFSKAIKSKLSMSCLQKVYSMHTIISFFVQNSYRDAIK